MAIKLIPGRLYRLKKKCGGWGKMRKVTDSSGDSVIIFRYESQQEKESTLLCLEEENLHYNRGNEMIVARFLVGDKDLHWVLYDESIHRSHGLPTEIMAKTLNDHVELLKPNKKN